MKEKEAKGRERNLALRRVLNHVNACNQIL